MVVCKDILYNALDSPLQQRFMWSQMATVLRLRTAVLKWNYSVV